MPVPFTQRVPPDFARDMFRRWNREGFLPVLLAIMDDLYDFQNADLQAVMEKQDMTDPKVLSDVRRRQGRLEENRRNRRQFEDWGQPEGPPQTRTDALDVRPPTDRARKRAGARF